MCFYFRLQNLIAELLGEKRSCSRHGHVNLDVIRFIIISLSIKQEQHLVETTANCVTLSKIFLIWNNCLFIRPIQNQSCKRLEA